jgi:hypothetical protein
VYLTSEIPRSRITGLSDVLNINTYRESAGSLDVAANSAS